MFTKLCRDTEHPDPILRGEYLPGRAFYTPEEEAAGCDEPRFCCYCILLTVNVMYHHNVRHDRSVGALNPFRVYTNIPGEYCVESVRQSVDGMTYSLLGYFPRYSEHTFVVRRADGPDAPYGFVSSEPVFRLREAARPTSQ